MTSQRQRLLDEAQWAIEHRQFDRAARVYRQLFEADPQSIQVGLKLGELYLKMEARREALEVYWRLSQAVPSEGSSEHQRTLLKLVLRLDPTRLEAQLRYLELISAALHALGDEGDGESATLQGEVRVCLQAITSLCAERSAPQRAEPLARVLALSIERLFTEELEELRACRVLYAESCEALERYQEGLPYFVWLTLDAERRQEPSQVARFGRLALTLDEQLSPELRRHLRLSIARALLPLAREDMSLVEQVYFALEPLTQGSPEEDLEAHLLLAHLLRLQGHQLHADALLHKIGSEARKNQLRSLAIVAYEAIITDRPRDPLALSALAQLNSAEALFQEAQRAFEDGQLEHALEYVRSLIDTGASGQELYELLIQIADALELPELQESSRLTLLEWALQYKIELALGPTRELCQQQNTSVLSFLRQHDWLYQSTRHALTTGPRAWLEELMSAPAPLVSDEPDEPDEVSPPSGGALTSQSALNRAQLQWGEASTSLSVPFTPAPLSAPISLKPSSHLPVSTGALEPTPSAPVTPPRHVGLPPPTPMIALPPLMRELKRSPPPPHGRLEQASDLQAPRAPVAPSTRDSKAIALYLEPTSPHSDGPLVEAPHGSPPPQSSGLNQIDDPLSLFDSGDSFDGALSADHPLAVDMIGDLFRDEQALSASLDKQLSLIKTPEPALPHPPLTSSPREASASPIVSELLLANGELIDELASESGRPQSQRLHLGVHPQLPRLSERLTQLKGRPPNDEQLSIVTLIDAQEYELASAHIPTHLKTSSIHYLKALCLYGQGHLEEALELVEITLSRAQPLRVAYFFALAAELSHVLRRDEHTERCLIELLALDPQLGATLYQALRS